MIAIATCWPDSVAAGSGTTVSQNALVSALALAGEEAKLLCTSRFGRTLSEVASREQANAALDFDGCEAVIGIDGEGWQWAASPARSAPYVAFCEAVLTEVLPYETGDSARVLAKQAEWEAGAARIADAVVARSNFAADRVADSYGVPRDRITVLPIPFDVDTFRASLPRLPKEALVLAVGHAYLRKNYGALLRAWPRVSEARPDAQLVIVGEGPETSALRQLAGRSVQLMGHLPLDELRSLHARAQVFCHPSLQENFGIAAVEGLASGASLVVHHQPAILENAGGLDGVWAVDARQPDEIARALIEALAGPTSWPDLRLDRLRHKLNPERIGRQLAGLLMSME